MITKDGTCVAHQNRENVKNIANIIESAKTDLQFAELAELQKKMIAGETGTGSYTVDGVRKYMGYAPVEGMSWSLAVTAPETEILSGIYSLRKIHPAYIPFTFTSRVGNNLLDIPKHNHAFKSCYFNYQCLS